MTGAPEDLADLRHALDCAIPTPWASERVGRADHWYITGPDWPNGRTCHVAHVAGAAMGSNAEMIVAAVNALPALLERVEVAEALVRAIEDSRLDPARAIVKADQLAGAAIIAAHKAEVDHAKCVPVSAWVDEVDELTGERDTLAAKVADAGSLADTLMQGDDHQTAEITAVVHELVRRFRAALGTEGA